VHNNETNFVASNPSPKKTNAFAAKFETILKNNVKQTMAESKVPDSIKTFESNKNIASNDVANYNNINFFSSQSPDKYENKPLPSSLFERKNVFLNMGSKCYDSSEWFYVVPQRVDVCVRPEQEVLRLAHDLEGFPDNSVSIVYSSHMLEHTSAGDDFNLITLREWYRVLRPGGMLFVAVPDLEVLCRMYLDPNMTVEQRFFITRMIYGGQTDRYDFHLFGYNEESLTLFLKEAGFCNIQRVGNFNLFMDTSAMEKFGYNISLNMVASVCPGVGETQDGFFIQHSADEYIKPNYIKL
jgi:predicted SAM-dependent methyltransferase